MRGVTPDRARAADLRHGSFKPGHEKRGGRKRSTPNQSSAEPKEAILEAAYHIGYDGNGKDGLNGYLMWVAKRDLTFFYTRLYVSLLPFEIAGINLSQEPSGTEREINERIRDNIEVANRNRAEYQRRVQVEPHVAWDRTGQSGSVRALMRLAVEKPKTFCRLLVAAFLRPPKKRRYFPAGAGAVGMGTDLVRRALYQIFGKLNESRSQLLRTTFGPDAALRGASMRSEMMAS